MNSTFSVLYSTLLKNICQDDKNEDFLLKISKTIFSYIAEEFRDEKKEDLFIIDPNGQRLVKSMIQNLSISAPKNKNMIENCISEFIELIEKRIEFFMNTKAIFILISIIESSEQKERLRSIILKS